MALVSAIALLARLAVLAWAHGRFPPAGDGIYYDRLAERIAHGLGYTWQWPDGVVTYAAHYPVGYPALIAPAYALFGSSPTSAAIVNALLGAACAVGAYRMLAGSSRTAAIVAGVVVGMHPALLPYTVAIMTEGATAALLCVAGAFAQAAREQQRPRRSIALAAMTLGLATLVRPQSIVLAPALGWLAVRAGGWRARAKGAALVSAIVVACCLPWTARNCARLDRCAFVSANGGWNLLIGTQGESGGWEPVDVPEPCRAVWGEAEKDACFGRGALARIAEDPGRWLALAPRKLSLTFDYLGGAPWYLHASNPSAFGEAAKLRAAAIETLAVRALLVAAIVAVIRLPGPRTLLRLVLGAAALVLAVLPWAFVSYVLLAVVVLLSGRRRLEEGPILVPWTAVVVLATAATHAVFFGSGRYGLVVVPLVTAVAFVRTGSPRA